MDPDRVNELHAHLFECRLNDPQVPKPLLRQHCGTLDILDGGDIHTSALGQI